MASLLLSGVVELLREAGKNPFTQEDEEVHMFANKILADNCIQ